MKQPEVFKKIGGIIQELNEQYEYLQSTAENLNDLELELFVANTHFLKDHAEILRKLNLLKQKQQPELPLYAEKEKIAVIDEPAAIVKASNEPRYFEPVVQQKPAERPPFKANTPAPQTADTLQFDMPASQHHEPHIDLHGDTPTDSYSFEREEPETIRHELILDEADTWDEEDDTEEAGEEELKADTVEPTEQVTEAEEPVPTNPEPVINNEPKTTAEVSDDGKAMSLNQKMAAQLKEQKNTTTEPAEMPIADIKAAITLNDKMLFIKDLFNGYPLAYSEAVEIVNRFKSFEEADRFLKTNYVTKNNWEAKMATSDKFYALLKRRYA